MHGENDEFMKTFSRIFWQGKLNLDHKSVLTTYLDEHIVLLCNIQLKRNTHPFSQQHCYLNQIFVKLNLGKNLELVWNGNLLLRTEINHFWSHSETYSWLSSFASSFVRARSSSSECSSFSYMSWISEISRSLAADSDKMRKLVSDVTLGDA